MLKKALFISSVASALIAGQYAVLKDGTTIILNENGTWEPVKLIDVKTPTSNGIHSSNIGTLIQQSEKASVMANEPLARMLAGKWESRDGNTMYDFKKDGSVEYILDGKKSTNKYSIESIDNEDRVVTINIGETERVGKVSLGGMFRKIQISKDGQNATDISDELSKLTTVKLKKVGNAVDYTPSTTTMSPTPKKIETPATNGFVK